MGVTYKAIDTVLNRPVALKEIASESAAVLRVALQIAQARPGNLSTGISNPAILWRRQPGRRVNCQAHRFRPGKGGGC
jgi:hypothetical protein